MSDARSTRSCSGRTCAIRWSLSGSTPKRREARVASLSDREIGQIAGQIDRLPAGQGVLVALIGAALFVFLVLLITDLLGLTHVFPFVRHPSR